MEITRFGKADAYSYSAPGHFGFSGKRLQGLEASSAAGFWVGFSTFQPKGGATWAASPTEKVYIVIEGEMTITTDEGSFTLGRYDSCRIAPNEERSMMNDSDAPAILIVVISN